MADTIRRMQRMLAEIEDLRRERVLLRGALAEIVHLDKAGDAGRYALKTLTKLPATAPWDWQAPVGHGDVGAAGATGRRRVRA